MAGFRGDAAFSTWVHGITLNSCKDWSRKRKRHSDRQVIDPDLEARPDPDADPEQSLFSRLIRRCIALLPEPLQAAVLLVHAEGLNHREAGAALDCAEGTISWRLSQARKQLATCLDTEA
jgi:RNA polymerase sigma-70 factor (ECF subfamily)